MTSLPCWGHHPQTLVVLEVLHKNLVLKFILSIKTQNTHTNKLSFRKNLEFLNKVKTYTKQKT